MGKKKNQWPNSDLQRWYDWLNRSDLRYSANLVYCNLILLFSPRHKEAVELCGLSIWQIFHNSHTNFFSLNYKNNNLNVNLFTQNNYRLLACQEFGEGGFWSRLYVKLKQNACEWSKNIRLLKHFGSVRRQMYITEKRNDTKIIKVGTRWKCSVVSWVCSILTGKRFGNYCMKVPKAFCPICSCNKEGKQDAGLWYC